jgi:hypothetical protein
VGSPRAEPGRLAGIENELLLAEKQSYAAGEDVDPFIALVGSLLWRASIGGQRELEGVQSTRR